jgi:putative transposase
MVPSVFGWRCKKRMSPGSTSNAALVHKTANVLDKLPKSLQDRAKELLHDIYLAPAHQDALKAYDRFLTDYQLKYPKACECLQKDKDTLFSFYHFPAEHWPHLRTTNPIQST